MIRYDRLWQTLADRKITQYRLIKQYGFSAGQIGRLKKNMNVSTHTLDTLCGILSCRIQDIAEFVPDLTEDEPPAPAPVPAEQTPEEAVSEAPRAAKSKKTGKSKKSDKSDKKSPKSGKKNKKGKS